ncbi:TRAP transporter small permease [Paracoccus fistulariae]|uniref:TRAP transporter small permease protein n=1 Tax=Paracoccus fistulariae TaxID=658446 RepID=A0ABY7SG43_9RHOB|nr:TRAP transporter small permease [Paracoccus fistulariae]MDB6181730.1 TRAP transporter small permease [Paracoccus fistulariae]WCR05971.1 TRAP transporter small permease [Paracoccus fistulariae]
MSHGYQPRGAVGHFVNRLEENTIAIILGLMTILTFVNVVLRYVFQSSLIWGLELTLALFAWLVLLGISHAVKINAHLGVDAVINLLSPTARRVLALTAGAFCILYAVLLLKGAWDYWAPFAGLQQTSGRWFPTGFIETRDRAFYETEQIPMPAFLGWMGDVFNMGEPYEKLPRMIPYMVLPIGVALLLFRLLQAVWMIWKGERQTLIVSHEAEDAIEDVRHLNRED